ARSHDDREVLYPSRDHLIPALFEYQDGIAPQFEYGWSGANLDCRSLSRGKIWNGIPGRETRSLIFSVHPHVQG
ncbi:MAG: hypothetical protein QHH30_07525, partial [candidate division NC10 bacterium]|nr:hypothetical protein [candidate division NC10 bacterium]